MLALNDPATITPILSWLAMTAFRSLFDQFPTLAILAQTGAGKTTMIELLLDVWWGQGRVQNIGSTTSFVDSVELTRSNLFPLPLDEYRGGATTKLRYRLLETDELIRVSYRRSGALKRGEATQHGTGVREARMNRPLIVLGEANFEDLAVRERSVIVQPKQAQRNTAAFNDLTRWVVGRSGAFGVSYLRWLVDTRGDLLIGEPPPLPSHELDRPSFNAAVLEKGWELLTEFAFEAAGVREIHMPLDLSRVKEEWQRDMRGNPIWLEGIEAAYSSGATYGERHLPIVFVHTGPTKTICIQVDELVKWMRREGFDLPGKTKTAKSALRDLFPGGEANVRRYFNRGLGDPVRIQVFDTGLTDISDYEPTV
jgi:hypothetical protein